MSYLHILKNPLLDISFANIFSHAVGYLFILLMVSLLCKSLVNVVPFVDVWFWCHVQKFTAKDQWERAASLLFFSPRSFIVSGLMFVSDPFWVNFYERCKMGVEFHCSACADPVFPTLFVKRLSFLPWVVLWALLSSISSLYQFSSVAQLCLTLCDPMNHSTPGLPVHHQLLEFTLTHVHRLGNAIQPSHPLSSPSPPAPNPSQHRGLFQWVSSSHEVAKVLEFQLQHQFFQWTPRTDLL